MIDLNRYCDLTPHQMEGLRDPEAAHPAMRNAFIRDGLVCRQNGRLLLTPDGRKALEIAEAYLSGERRPDPPLLEVQTGDFRFRPDRRRGLCAAHFKALKDLALHPGLAWRWLCSVYSPQVVRQLWAGGYIFGRRVRGAPQYITEKGLRALTEALDRARVRYRLLCDKGRDNE